MKIRWTGIRSNFDCSIQWTLRLEKDIDLLPRVGGTARLRWLTQIKPHELNLADRAGYRLHGRHPHEDMGVNAAIDKTVRQPSFSV